MYILALDLETTGLDSNYNEIGRFETLVCPKQSERGYRKDFSVYKYIGTSEDGLQPAPDLKFSLNSLENFVFCTAPLPVYSRNYLKQVVLLGQKGFD